MRSRLSSLRTQATSVSSLYTSGQCFLSVLGSIGVILLFAGIPQIIYSAHVNPTNLLTFIIGAFLVTLMVAGNAFIGHKYRQLIRSRREDRPHRSASALRDDKPPSYDDLVKQDGLPPEYEAAIHDKPPIYSELVHEVINWEAILSSSYSPSCSSTPCKPNEEAPILAPVHREVERLRRSTASTSGGLSGGNKTAPDEDVVSSDASATVTDEVAPETTSQVVANDRLSAEADAPPVAIFDSDDTLFGDHREDRHGRRCNFIEIEIHGEETYF